MAEVKKIFGRNEIEKIMPQQEPFLFIDKAEIDGNCITGTYTIKPDEPVLKGHFKGNPVFPGTLMLETLGQLAVLYLLVSDNPLIEKPVDPAKIFFTSADGTRCMRICRPNETFQITAKLTKIKHPLAMFEAKLSVDDKCAAFAEKICLTFDYKA